MKTRFIIAPVLALIAIGVACRKMTVPTPVTAPTPYFVRLTDAPGPYSAVNVDIQGLQVIGGGTTVNLNVTPGIYNLLNFSNGVDTLIATGSLQISTVEQIRLILGPNNSVVVGGASFPLKTSSAEHSGLKLQVHQTLQAGLAYYVLLDFDALKSIVVQGNGDYLLKPVIRTIDTAISGALSGTIIPAAAGTSVTAASATNTYSTIAAASGNFLFSGLPAGTYTVQVNPPAPYITNSVTINVSTGVTATTGTLAI